MIGRGLMIGLAFVFVSCSPIQEGPQRDARPSHNMRALDGDTLLFDDTVVRIAGIDAPELGPAARCWAEAALGGVSRSALAEALEGPLARDWQLAEVSAPDDSGRIRANLITNEGADLRDHLVVYGYAARTDGRWNWCGHDANLHSPRYDEAPPHGPSLWWPSGRMFDRRAFD